MHEQAEIPHNTLVVVGDGRKALFLRNHGAQLNIQLEVERRLLHETPATHDMGTDRPGRTVSGPGGVRSAMEQTDWHHLEEDRFVDTIAAVLAREAALRHTDNYSVLMSHFTRQHNVEPQDIRTYLGVGPDYEDLC
jgi:protein required for attachment to host cells